MKLTREELLVLLIEECSEVIQAATKCLRFGYDVDHNTGYGNNKNQLSKELGELDAVASRLDLDLNSMTEGRSTKVSRAEKAKAEFGNANPKL